MEEYLAIIKMFAGNFAPRTFMLCQGQILPIAQNTALFSLLGTTYGGNGQNTFALPDLRGRAPIGTGQGPGLNSYVLGEIGGSESITILQTQMPAHSHVITLSNLVIADNSTPNAATASGNRLANSPKTGSGPNASTLNTYTTGTGNPVTLNSTGGATAGITGGSQPISILSPYLAINFVITTVGLFPSRN